MLAVVEKLLWSSHSWFSFMDTPFFNSKLAQVCPCGIIGTLLYLIKSKKGAVENIFENSDFIYMLNQAARDRQILAKQLNISPHQLSYVTHSGEGEGLLCYGNVILPFVDRFPKDTELYRIMTTKPNE